MFDTSRNQRIETGRYDAVSGDEVEDDGIPATKLGDTGLEPVTSRV